MHYQHCIRFREDSLLIRSERVIAIIVLCVIKDEVYLNTVLTCPYSIYTERPICTEFIPFILAVPSLE